MTKFFVALLFLIPFRSEALKCIHTHSFVLKCEKDKCTKAFLYQPYDEGPCPNAKASKDNYKIYPLKMELPFEDLETHDPVGVFGYYCANEIDDPGSSYKISADGVMTLICPSKVWKGITPIKTNLVTIEEIRKELIQKDKDDERHFWISKLSHAFGIMMGLIGIVLTFVWIKKRKT
jgi:hypothetical protein